MMLSKILSKTNQLHINSLIMSGPTYTSIIKKLTSQLEPNTLNVINESHKHAHHKAMKDNTNPETHFKIEIVSDRFQNMSLVQRHRKIYEILDEELKVKGVHALSLSTKTLQESLKQ